MLRPRKTFRQAEVDSHRHVSNEFADWWEYIPLAAGENVNAMPGPDPNRERYGLPGVFTWEASAVNLRFKEMQVASRDPELAVMACDLKYPARRQDVVRRCGDNLTFTITEIKPDGFSGVVFCLSQYGRHIQ